MKPKTICGIVLSCAWVAMAFTVHAARSNLWSIALNRRLVAPSNGSAEAKAVADYVCSGTNDERVIAAAIESLARGGTVQLLDGDYFIDGFDGENNTAILFGYNGGVARTVTISGTTENKSYNSHFGAVLHVTKRAMTAMSTEGCYRVFGGTARKPKSKGAYWMYTHVNNANFRNFYILFADALKPVVGIDGRCFGNMSLEQTGVFTERFEDDRYLHRKPATPVRGCVGYWSVPGANDDASRIGYDCADAGGLYAGFVLEGVEHLVMRSCSVSRCCYGYVFRGNASKPLTMINCADEGNTHLPRFEGRGLLTCIDFVIERFSEAFVPDDPEGVKEPLAVETQLGGWRGFMSFAWQGRAAAGRSFWKKGSGVNFKTFDLKGLKNE